VHHVLAVEAVLPDGELVQIGSPLADAPGPDLLGLVIGSEGTLAVVTKVVVRILRKPERVQTLLAAFDSIGTAGS
jgi:glycolate oxidase